MYDTFDETYGPDTAASADPRAALAVSGAARGYQVPVHVDPGLRGLKGTLHPGVSPTPYVIGLALLLVLLLHPRAGFNATASVGK